MVQSSSFQCSVLWCSAMHCSVGQHPVVGCSVLSIDVLLTSETQSTVDDVHLD